MSRAISKQDGTAERVRSNRLAENGGTRTRMVGFHVTGIEQLYQEFARRIGKGASAFSTERGRQDVEVFLW